ncbi:MAG: MFS transporter [Burkholderiaceae bacterium]
MHLPPMSKPEGPPEADRITGRAWFAFGLTFALMLIDFIDRQIVASMFPFLKAEWQLSDQQLGALMSAVSATVALGAIPVAVLADRWGRVRMVVVMALTWSSATLACGLANSYHALLAARAVVGLGEAGYGPAGGAILSGVFPRRLHSAILGAVQAAGAIGSILGVVLGGILAARYGWKATFGIVAVPGFVLGLCYLWVRDPTQGRPAAAGASGPSILRTLWNGLTLFRKPVVLWSCVGGALQVFVIVALYTWMPSYVNRVYGVAPDKAGTQAAVFILLGALGSIAWGYAVDRLGRGDVARRLRVVAVGAALSGGLLVAGFGLLPPGSLQWAVILAGGFCVTCSIGAVPAVVLEATEAGIRATALALVAMAQNLFGQALGPLAAGAMSDALGLDRALAVASTSAFFAAAAFVWAGVAHRRHQVRCPAAFTSAQA